MAIEHSGIAIETDVIKTNLLDMEGDYVGKAESAFIIKTKIETIVSTTLRQAAAPTGTPNITSKVSNAITVNK